MDAARDQLPDPKRSPATLGDVLYARPKVLVSEAEWVALVRSVSAGDQGALHALYERAHRAVFTLIMRVTANRETAEEVTLDVFHDVWRRASQYQEADGTVLGWIVMQARSRALDRLRFDPLMPNDPGLMADLADVLGTIADGELEGEPRRLVVAALAIDKDHAKARALLASAELRRGRLAEARHHWEALLASAPAGSQAAVLAQQGIAKVRELSGGKR
jgi:RNA polymerase sigma-70 factor (ECF subfamily)